MRGLQGTKIPAGFGNPARRFQGFGNPAGMLMVVLALLLQLAAAVAQEGVPGGGQYRYIERSLLHNDPLAKKPISTGGAKDTTASLYWNRIAVFDKPAGGITYYLSYDSLATYAVPDTLLLQKRHRWFLNGSWSSWATVLTTVAKSDTATATVPYSTSGKFYDVQLRAVMVEKDSTGTAGSGCNVRGGALFW